MRNKWKHSKLLWASLSLTMLLVAGRLAGPWIVASVVRKALHQLVGGYHGDIDDVDLSVVTGEVHILGLRIVKRNGSVPVPFMQVERFTLAFVRRGLRMRTVLRLVEPRVSFVDADSTEAQQWGPDFELEELRKQLPFELTALYMEGGQVHFRNFESAPAVDVYLRKLALSWEKLEGCLPPGSRSCQSTLTARAGAMGSAALRLRGTFAREDGPKLQALADLRHLQIAQLNPLLIAYAKIDAQGGKADVQIRYTQQRETQRLLLVPRLYDVDIAGQRNEGSSWVREAAAGIAAGWFERRRGKKALLYTRHAGKGTWHVIDWSSDFLDEARDGTSAAAEHK